MKLNMDCVRDVMLSLEDELTFQNNLGFKIKSFNEIIKIERLGKYSKEDVFFSLFNLKESGYIEAKFYPTLNGDQNCSVRNITFSGHEFIQNVRSDSIWSNAKELVMKIGSASISVISDISKDLILKQLLKS